MKENFLKNPETAVEAVLKGVLAQSCGHLERVDGHFAVVCHSNRGRKVKIVTGGGSGHEPLFLGAAGPGMADGAVAGEVFSAPNPFSIEATADACEAEEGVVYIYGNYNGDVLNFGFAAEEGISKGKPAAEIRVHDDIASRPPEQMTERRGTAGDVFVIKCAAAAADLGGSLEEVLRIGEKVNQRVRSIGVALRAASTIDTGEPMFDLPPGEMEIGIGLHGEMGVRRAKAAPADELVPEMLALIFADFKATGYQPERVAVMVNGLGGSTAFELLIVSGLVENGLKERGVESGLFVVGEFATSLDMQGFSITLLDLDDEIEALLAAPCESLCFSQHPASIE